MSIYIQQSKGRKSYRVFVKLGTIIFEAGLSLKKYGRDNGLIYANELKAIAMDTRIPVTTRKRLFRERREQIKCQK